MPFDGLPEVDLVRRHRSGRLDDALGADYGGASFEEAGRQRVGAGLRGHHGFA
jgi:hypothetical protein